MKAEDTLEITLDDLEYEPERQCLTITEVARNLELSLNRAIRWLKAHKVSKIILRNGKLNAIKEEEEEKKYEKGFKSFLKLIANSWHLRHVELRGISISSRFFKDLRQAISELGKTKKIRLRFGISFKKP